MYKHKYLKYKNKYLNIKNKMYGNGNWTDLPNITKINTDKLTEINQEIDDINKMLQKYKKKLDSLNYTKNILEQILKSSN